MPQANNDKIPQFLGNPNFRRFLVFLVILSLLLAGIYLIYSTYVRQLSADANTALLHKLLDSYYSATQEYPPNLETLVEVNIINIIPEKNEGTPFTYQAIVDPESGKVVDYKLE